MAFCWQCIGAWQDSQTTDEGVHLTAGLSYWQAAAWRLNPEHPPLMKLLASAPVLLLPHARVSTTDAAWRTGNEWLIAANFLYNSVAASHYGPRVLMLYGRLPMIGLFLVLLFILYRWAQEHWGHWPALATLALAAFDPNLLGHGHLVTNDIGVAMLFVAVCWRLEHLLRRPTWRELFVVAGLFGLAELMKFSALILWLIVPGVAAIRLMFPAGDWSWRWWRRLIISLVVVSFFLTWTMYGFNLSRPDADPAVAQLWTVRQTMIDARTVSQQPRLIQLAIAAANPNHLTGRWLADIEHWTIPAYWYWRGIFSDLTHNAYGHSAYLLGQVSTQGWWYYFPVTVVVKMPPLLLAIMIFWGGWQVSRWRHRRRATSAAERNVFGAGWTMFVPPVIFLWWSLTSHINIGLRHIFPMYVFVPLTGGSLIFALKRFRSRLVKWLVLAIALISISVSWHAWPNTIGYFNLMAGGTRGGYRYLLDSNLDWNQDIWRLQTFLHQHHFDHAHLVLFGSIPYDSVFPGHLSVLTDQDIAAGVRPDGIVVISAGQLYNADGPFHWLRAYPPTWRVGSSITVYDFR